VFEHELCALLKIPTPRELYARMTPGEVKQWKRYFEERQPGQDGQDARSAINRAELYAALFGMMGKKKNFNPSQFLYRFKPQEQSQDDIKRMAKNIARAFGGEVKD